MFFKVENEYKGANIPRTIRFTEKIFDKLNEISTENDISFNLLVLQCCKYAITLIEQEPKSEHNPSSEPPPKKINITVKKQHPPPND